MDLTVEYSSSGEKTPVLDKIPVLDDARTDRKGSSHQADIVDPSQEEEEIENMITTELPDELAALRYCVFESNEELQTELDLLGLGDLPVELDGEGKAFLEMPSDEHNKATSWLTRRFTLWAKERWGYATSTNTVKLNNSKTRLSDVSFWGYPRCQWKPELGELDVKIGEIEPDVVIQFSCKNRLDYEKSAINDMMNRSTGNGNAVRVGYLVKMRFDNGERNAPTGLDIYKVPRGKTVADAIANTGGAIHFSYTPGQADVIVEITPSDLGITGFWAFFCGSFKFSIAKLWSLVESVYL